MSSTIKTTSALAAFAVVALMADPAIAGKPLNVVQKKALADAKVQQVQAAAASPVVVGADGSPAAVVPEELHNFIHVQKDANGNLRILETDGSTAPPEAVEVTNE
ncbi:hypothetical protein [Thermomonas sp.]|uniref:hypothetical protein n=1 Tax=Thermomonas sp. TaxID=1971895 RepID=UPI0035B4E3DE